MHIKNSERVIPTLDAGGAAVYALAGATAGGTGKHQLLEIALPPQAVYELSLAANCEGSLYVVQGEIAPTNLPDVLPEGSGLALPASSAVTLHNSAAASALLVLALTPVDPPYSENLLPVQRDLNALAILQTPHGEIVREFFGAAAGGTRHHSLAYITLPSGKHSLKHYHPIAEESYYILSGSGRILVDSEERRCSVGDAVAIPPNAVHQIFNNGDTVLTFLAVCVPAWTPDCSVFIQ